MYKDRKKVYKNGYIVVEMPEHPRAFDTGTGIIGIYEHILIAEQFVVDRAIKEGEVVHHLDCQRDNNSPNNLLVLSSAMHCKLHKWMNKHSITPSEKEQEKIDRGCVRCKYCKIPIDSHAVFCSNDCKIKHNDYNNPNRDGYFGTKYPSLEEMKKLLWEKPTTQVAKELGVSDVSISKFCKKFEIDKPPRGYWNKIKSKSNSTAITNC